jgi:hypothetical protein
MAGAGATLGEDITVGEGITVGECGALGAAVGTVGPVGVKVGISGSQGACGGTVVTAKRSTAPSGPGPLRPGCDERVAVSPTSNDMSNSLNDPSVWASSTHGFGLRPQPLEHMPNRASASTRVELQCGEYGVWLSTSDKWK